MLLKATLYKSRKLIYITLWYIHVLLIETLYTNFEITLVRLYTKTAYAIIAKKSLLSFDIERSVTVYFNELMFKYLHICQHWHNRLVGNETSARADNVVLNINARFFFESHFSSNGWNWNLNFYTIYYLESSVQILSYGESHSKVCVLKGNTIVIIIVFNYLHAT